MKVEEQERLPVCPRTTHPYYKSERNKQASEMQVLFPQDEELPIPIFPCFFPKHPGLSPFCSEAFMSPVSTISETHCASY